jgi:hypothetical protein
VRWSRSLCLATTLLILTLAGHSAASGALPSAAACLITAAPALALTLAVSARRRSMAWLTGYLLLGELLLHLVLSAASGHAHALLPSPVMLAAHTVASIVAAAVFAQGEQLAARWTAYLGQALGIPSLRLPALPIHLAPAPAGVVDHAAGLLLAHHVARRGPPALVA